MRDRILLLMPTTTYRAEPFFEAARRMGVDVAIGSDRCHVIARDDPAAARGALPLDFRDPDEAAAAIVEAARRSSPPGSATPAFRAIVPVDDRTTVIAAKASEALGLPSNPVGAAAAARDKRRFREALAAAGLPCPRFRVLPLSLAGADVGAAAREVPSYPVVLKPLALAASQGVIRADDAAGFEAAFARIARLLRSPDIAARRDPALEAVLVEDFVPGVEVALEGMLRAGALRALAIFDKPDPLDGPFFEETIYVTPSRHAPDVQARIVETAAAAARAIGLREGPVHVEVRVGAPLTPTLSQGEREHEAFAIELAARSIGGLCSRTLRFGTGVTLEELILRHALGRDGGLDALERERRPAGVMMVPIPRAGVLRSVAGVEAAKAVPGVEDVTVTQKLDTEVVPLPEGASYLGFIFARGETPAAVEASLREAHARLRFEIAPTLPSIDVRRPRAASAPAPGGPCRDDA